MRSFGDRKKKLIVAFHFEVSNPGGWNCDECRRAGLERKRRCGWLPEQERDATRVVWTRGKAHCEICPRSAVTSESAVFIEEFAAWKRLGGGAMEQRSARQVDAFLLLDIELEEENRERRRRANR